VAKGQHGAMQNRIIAPQSATVVRIATVSPRRINADE